MLLTPLITLGRTFELLDIDVGQVVAKVDHVFMRGMFCYRVERRKALAGGLTDGHVPNLTVGAIQRNYQSMLQRLHSFALLTHRDAAVPACLI